MYLVKVKLKLINDSKNTLEGGGFYQLVQNITRSWPGAVDSLIDHFWTNDPHKILSVSNIVRPVGDHNLITAVIRLKGKDSNKLDIRKRSFVNFDPVTYRNLLQNEDWADIYDIEDVDIANDFL